MLGSGVRNIVKYSKVYSNIDPVFVDGDIFKTQIALNAAKNENVGVNVPRNVPQNVPQKNKEEMIINLIKNNPNISRKEMANEIGVTIKTIQRIINKNEHIKYVGSSKTGHWEIID